ncbi:hypothetical protein K0U27_07275 [archaeon]|nr:hypothetical protein [archaeon]
MTKITRKQKDIAKAMSLVAVIGVFMTATGTGQAFAFDLSGSAQPAIQNTLIIAAEESSDCGEIGHWDQYSNTCVIDGRMVAGVTTKVLVQQNAVLEIQSDAILTVYGIVENHGTVNNHGQILNHGTVENFKMFANDGTVKNFWGKIVNSEGALLVNGGYVHDGKMGLRYVGTVENRYGTIQNSGILTNHSMLNNHWGTVLNDCLGTMMGTGYATGNDVKQMECRVVVDMDRLQG